MTSESWCPEPPPERGASWSLPAPVDCPDCGNLWPASTPTCPTCGLDVEDLDAAAAFYDRLKGTR